MQAKETQPAPAAVDEAPEPAANPDMSRGLQPEASSDVSRGPPLEAPRDVSPPAAPDPFSYDDDASRWHAVRARDPCADGLFVYAVKTTKIYCRPVCKARLARRANVRFFATCGAAQDAGFRACKRCKPRLDGFMPEERAVRQIRAMVAGAQPAGAPSLGQMAARAGMSKWHFHRAFKASLGLTPGQFLRERRASGPVDASMQPIPGRGEHGLAVFDDPAADLEASVLGEAPAVSGRRELRPFSIHDLLDWPEDDDT